MDDSVMMGIATASVVALTGIAWRVASAVFRIRDDLCYLRCQVGGFRHDLCYLRCQVGGLREDARGLREDLRRLRSQVVTLHSDMVAICAVDGEDIEWPEDWSRWVGQIERQTSYQSPGCNICGASGAVALGPDAFGDLRCAVCGRHAVKVPA